MKTNWEHSELHVGCKKRCRPVTIGSHSYLFGVQTVDPFDIMQSMDICTHTFLQKKVTRQFHNFHFNNQLSSLNKK